jgi:hypothetical protein
MENPRTCLKAEEADEFGGEDKCHREKEWITQRICPGGSCAAVVQYSVALCNVEGFCAVVV